jgi:hypothetical protein
MASRMYAWSLVGALACSPGPTGEDEAAVTTDPSGSDSDGGSSSGASTSESDSSVKLDVLVQGDLPPQGPCTVTVTDEAVLEEHPDCELYNGGGCAWAIFLGCVVPQPGQTCAELCPAGNCVANWENCAGDSAEPDTICGPYEIEGQCCSIGQSSSTCTG